MKNLVVIFASLLLITSCSVFQNADKLELKKQNKAKNTVLENDSLSAVVLGVLRDRYPCVVEETHKDSIVTELKYKTLPPFTIPVILKQYVRIDTTIRGLKFVIDSSGVNVSGVYECEDSVVYRKTITRDLSYEKALGDTINNKNKKIAYYQGANDQLKITVHEQKKQREKDKWLIIGLGALVLVLIFIILKQNLGSISKLPKNIWSTITNLIKSKK